MGSGRSGGVAVRKTARGRRAPHEGHEGGAAVTNATAVAVDLADLATAAQSSPLIAQYAELKKQYPRALLLSRVGDFYEAYGADANDLAESVGIVLTSKESGKGRRVAMAGVPYHQLDTYVGRLMRQQRVVAIAEQMEPPAPNRLVRREIARVLTPGTVLEDQFLAPERNNYICAVASVGAACGVAAADVSTAAASVCVAPNDDETAAELDRLAPAEIIVADEADAQRVGSLVAPGCRVTMWFGASDDGLHETARNGRPGAPANVLAGLASEERPAASAALDLLSTYLDYLKLDGASIVGRTVARDARAAMVVDPSTRRHLDVLRGSGANERASLVGVLSRTKSPPGGRLLAQWLCAPSLDIDEIRRRHDRVGFFVDHPTVRFALQAHLGRVGDIERLVQKIHARRANPRDGAGLRESLRAVRRLHDELNAGASTPGDPCCETFARQLESAAQSDLGPLLDRALVDDPAPQIADGGVIAPEYSPALRDLVELRAHARRRLLELEDRTRARTAIKSLKIKYTQAFGYYYEVTRAQAAGVPDDFIRRQSLVNAERFSDEELGKLEADILSAKSRQVAVERELFDALLEAIDAARDTLLAAARVVAELDVFCALGHVAGERGYVRPTMVAESVVHVESGRHPILEAFGGLDFVPNDCHVDADRRFLCITGPNMGGKSTYLRQTALIAILAQSGSFVPANRATLGIIDRLFTRIGAGDDIAAGRSTFYVEMAEIALILRRCTLRSLLLIDEVGRGTGTTDGRSIAQAISEYLLGLDDAMPMVLFATHFHELVRLAAVFPVMENLHVAVVDEKKGPVFSHRLLPGSSSRSYGIEVAQMAGLPEEVVARAQEIAAQIESRPELAPRAVRGKRGAGAKRDRSQLPLEM